MSRQLDLFYCDLESPNQSRYSLGPSKDPAHYNLMRANPDTNLTFQGNYDVQPDEVLACHFNSVFVGGLILINHPHRHTAMHLCLDRVNYKDTIHYFAELTILYVLAHSRLPMTLVPANLRAMRFWMSHVIGIRPATVTQSTAMADGNPEHGCVYLLPDDWAPRYVNNVVFNWRT